MGCSRSSRRAIDGFLVVDKPQGYSSAAVLNKVKHLYRASKAGHAGTLDPLATGLLLICFGRATKLLRFLLDTDKRYRVVAQLGVQTDTGDADGQVIARHDVSVCEADIHEALENFRGEISQVPPMHSALKHKGQPLYVLARAGQVVGREARRVVIHENCLHSFDAKAATMTLDIHCSKGTYIRSLVEDIGSYFGCGAHVKVLRRTAVGDFSDGNMHTLSALASSYERGGLVELDTLLGSSEVLIQRYPELILSNRDIMDLRHGRKLVKTFVAEEGWVRIVTEQSKVVACGCLGAGGRMVLPIVWLRDPIVDIL